MREALEAKVIGTNRVNAYASELYKQMVTIFEPFVGQKIYKQSCSLMEKVKKLMPELPHEPHKVMVHRSFDRYSLAFNVRTCEEVKGAGYFIYSEVLVGIGQMRNGILEKIKEPAEYRTDYTADEIEQKRKKYRELNDAMNEAKFALYPFGEYDR